MSNPEIVGRHTRVCQYSNTGRGSPCPECESFEFDNREGDLESYVFQAIGAASVCWESLNGTGIFDSTRAKGIGDKLLEKIYERFDCSYCRDYGV